jgi:hypothetical protein
VRQASASSRASAPRATGGVTARRSRPIATRARALRRTALTTAWSGMKFPRDMCASACRPVLHLLTPHTAHHIKTCAHPPVCATPRRSPRRSPCRSPCRSPRRSPRIPRPSRGLGRSRRWYERSTKRGKRYEKPPRVTRAWPAAHGTSRPSSEPEEMASRKMSPVLTARAEHAAEQGYCFKSALRPYKTPRKLDSLWKM